MLDRVRERENAARAAMTADVARRCTDFLAPERLVVEPHVRAVDRARRNDGGGGGEPAGPRVTRSSRQMISV